MSDDETVNNGILKPMNLRLTNIINNTIINNNNLLQQNNEEETLKKNLSLLYIFYLLRYNDGNNDLYPKIETYLSLNTKKNIDPYSMSQHDTKLMNNNQKEIKNRLISLKNSYSDPDIEEIEKVIDGTSDFIYNISQYILKNNNKNNNENNNKNNNENNNKNNNENNNKNDLIGKIKLFLENSSEPLYYHDRVDINLNNEVVHLYNTDYEIVAGNQDDDLILRKVTGNNNSLKKFINVLKENNVLKYYVADNNANINNPSEYTFLFVDDGWYWVDNNNNKLKINQNDKDYIYQYNCRLSLWGWFCGYDEPGLKVIKSSGSEELLPKGNTYIYNKRIKNIPNDEKKLLLLATIEECKEKCLYDIVSFENKFNSIKNAVFSNSCNIYQYSKITRNVIEYIRFKNPKDCMI